MLVDSAAAAAMDGLGVDTIEFLHVPLPLSGRRCHLATTILALCPGHFLCSLGNLVLGIVIVVTTSTTTITAAATIVCR